jgi:hypothetical protein
LGMVFSSLHTKPWALLFHIFMGMQASPKRALMK